MSAPDRLTVLTTAGRDRGKLATKRITRNASGEWQIEDYSQATWWSVRRIEVHDLVSLGQALASLEGKACSCIIRGEPIEGIDLSCCRRLKDATEDGTPPSFAPTPRQWFGIDFDSVPMPIWDTERLASRREAILRDRAEQHEPAAWPDDPAEVIEPDPVGDRDPEPIDPVNDWAICIRAAVVSLPAQFHDASGYWQLTSGAGIKDGIRARIWFWCDRPVNDDDAKRWLERSPIDTSLYCANTPHYTARPIFDPPELDPVSLRSEWWWRHQNVIAVPDLQEKPRSKPETRPRQFATSGASAERYAQACIDGIVAAPDGQGRKKAISVARLLYGMAGHGLLDQTKVTAALTDAMRARGWGQAERGRWSEAEIERHLAYARSHADTTLPEGFR